MIGFYDGIILISEQSHQALPYFSNLPSHGDEEIEI